MSDLNLAVIGNSAITALVDRRARIVWCCFPRFDGDPIFCSLLEVADDPTGAGLFDIELTNLESAKQEYVRNTAILVTTLTDDAGATVQALWATVPPDDLSAPCRPACRQSASSHSRQTSFGLWRHADDADPREQSHPLHLIHLGVTPHNRCADFLPCRGSALRSGRAG